MDETDQAQARVQQHLYIRELHGAFDEDLLRSCGLGEGRGAVGRSRVRAWEPCACEPQSWSFDECIPSSPGAQHQLLYYSVTARAVLWRRVLLSGLALWTRPHLVRSPLLRYTSFEPVQSPAARSVQGHHPDVVCSVRTPEGVSP